MTTHEQKEHAMMPLIFHLGRDPGEKYPIRLALCELSEDRDDVGKGNKMCRDQSRFTALGSEGGGLIRSARLRLITPFLCVIVNSSSQILLCTPLAPAVKTAR